jgi:hypothetical protein
MTNQERAQKIMKAYEAEDTYNFPNDGVAAALREVINQLQKGTTVGVVIMCADVLELCEELKKL